MARVHLHSRDGQVELLRDGRPFPVRGVGGWRHLPLLAQAGGTCLRTWDADGVDALLDEAHRLGLGVVLGIRIEHPRHGFDYGDAEAVAAQRARALASVERYRHHPALLMWSLGNEVSLESDPEGPLREIGALAREVKQLDPDHPVLTVLAGVKHHTMQAVHQYGEALDLIGINGYGVAVDVPQDLRNAGWNRPYLLTEYGPRGWWESPSTEWGAQIEPTSAEKCETYRAAYEAVQRDPQGLGSFAFLWGHKQEATSTWFGMFLKDGTRTSIVDTMARCWGQPLPDAAPQMQSMSLRDHVLAPGTDGAASCQVDGADWRLLARVVPESTDRKIGGDAEAAPAPVRGCIVSTNSTDVAFRAPLEPGPYRLFVEARSARGHAGTANVPFLVQ